MKVYLYIKTDNRKYLKIYFLTVKNISERYKHKKINIKNLLTMEGLNVKNK